MYQALRRRRSRSSVASDRQRRQRKQIARLPTIWRPNADSDDGAINPQRLALESKADILFYGGQAGGGKTDLLLGAALTQHRKSVIFRRVRPNLKGIVSRAMEIIGKRGKLNKQDYTYNLKDGRQIEFGSCQYDADKLKQQGRARDFYGFDEGTEFTWSIISYVTTWNRSTIRDQRCRVIICFDPPTKPEGMWIIDKLLPWLAFLYPDEFDHERPAAPGELRWYATVDGKEVECPNGDLFTDGDEIRPQSRTFIPAALGDNPHLAKTTYRARLDSLPEPLRSIFRDGRFITSFADNAWQVIPAAWVEAAMLRHEQGERPRRETDTLGVDPARGGSDLAAVAERIGDWFDLETRDGRDVPQGQHLAQWVIAGLAGGAARVQLEISGIGASSFDILSEYLEVGEQLISINPAARGGHVDEFGQWTQATDQTGLLKMGNLRAEMWWQMRDALDPANRREIALPRSTRLKAGLTAPTWRLTTRGVMIELKERIKQRLTYSPDEAEAIIFANYEPMVIEQEDDPPVVASGMWSY